MDLAHDLDLIRKRLKIGRAHITNTTDELLSTLNEFLVTADTLSVTFPQDQEFAQAVQQLFAETQRILPLKAVIGEHRETYAYISRLHKDIEKKFTVNPDALGTRNAPGMRRDAVDKVVAQQLILEGSAEVCEDFQRARNLNIISPSIREQYQAFMVFTRHLEAGDIDQALACQTLLPLPVQLLFQLHKAKFVRILRTRRVEEAVSYAKDHFEPFTELEKPEIERLMGALIFTGNLSESPYRDLAHPDFEARLFRDIAAEASKSIGLQQMSGLETVINAGVQAVPQLMQAVPLMQEKMWRTQLPVEMRLTPDLRFHSLFVCPVTKEVTGADNPPMLLPCGHAISRHALESLAKSSSRGKFKCPTCPVEAGVKDAMELVLT